MFITLFIYLYGILSAKPAPYNTHGEAVKDLPREVNKFAKAGGDLERRVAFEEDSSSSR